MNERDSRPEIIKCALNTEDIERYNLPPDLTKGTDTRAAAFVALHGDPGALVCAQIVHILHHLRAVDQMAGPPPWKGRANSSALWVPVKRILQGGHDEGWGANLPTGT